MIFNSSSNGLVPNFSIVGGTVEPGIKKQNTIWVETESPITGYTFSDVEPYSAAERYDGLLLIKTDCESYVDTFSVFESNNVTVFPMRARQYVDGAWNNVNARRYHDDTYTVWFNDIIFNSDINTETWTTKSYGGSNAGPGCDTVTYNGVTCKRIYSIYGSKTRGTTYISHPIDLTGWTTLTATIVNTYNEVLNPTEFCLGIWITPSDSITDALDYVSYNFTADSNSDERIITMSLDVSKINTKRYVGFYFFRDYTFDSHVIISEIRLT